jgi:nitroimidazol reductase NimA-like FMN-containing flavoprotein (pyridoxamine 5'-phosphate oxidase superfamily)
MPERKADETAGTPPPHPGDIGRRVALRRRELGLTREEAAERAGMAPGYLEYLETRPGETAISGLLRLAAALETTLTELLGGGVDVPPGRGGAKGRPALEELGTEECWDRLADRGVGRVGFTTSDGPLVLPVNYRVSAGTVLFRTAPGSATAAAVGNRVAFEVDHVDDALSQGWSVLVVGRAEAEAEDAATEAEAAAAGPTPWAGGSRDLLVRIAPDSVTGRVIRT